MSYPFVLNMPVELRLELMTSVGSYCMNTKRKLLDHVIDKIDGVLLIVTLVNL